MTRLRGFAMGSVLLPALPSCGPPPANAPPPATTTSPAAATPPVLAPGDVVLAAFPGDDASNFQKLLQELIYLLKKTKDIPMNSESKSKSEEIDNEAVTECAKCVLVHDSYMNASNKLLLKNAKTVLLLQNPRDAALAYLSWWWRRRQGYAYHGDHGDHDDHSDHSDYDESGDHGDHTDHGDRLLWPAFLAAFLSGQLPNGSWFDFVKSWWPQAYKDNTQLVFLDEFKKHPVPVLHGVAAFLQDRKSEHAVVDDVTLNTLLQGCNVLVPSDNPARLYNYTGSTGDWKHQFTVNQNTAFKKVYSFLMKDINIPFQYS